MSIEGQGHFFTIYFPGFVCFVLYYAKISGERLQNHWSSDFIWSLNTDLTVYCFLLHTGSGYIDTGESNVDTLGRGLGQSEMDRRKRRK